MRLIAALLIVLVTIPVIEAARGDGAGAGMAVTDIAYKHGSETSGQKTMENTAICPSFVCQNGLTPEAMLSDPRHAVMPSAILLGGSHPPGQVHAPLPRPPWGMSA